MSRQIRVGIAGLGRSGFGIHAEYLKTDPRFLVTAAADELEERRKDAEQLFHCRTFRNHTEMLAAISSSTQLQAVFTGRLPWKRSRPAWTF